jgi:DNA-binding MarR family transcriptional regulator
VASGDSLHYFLKGYRETGQEPQIEKGLPDAKDILWAFADLDKTSLPLSEISSWFMISKADTSRLVKELMKENLVSLSSSGDIALGNIVELTGRGKSLVKQLRT